MPDSTAGLCEITEIYFFTGLSVPPGNGRRRKEGGKEEWIRIRSSKR